MAMRRRLTGWLFGTLMLLRMTLSPAYASLLGTVFEAVHRVRDALPVRVRADKQGRGVWRDTTTRFGRTLELALALRTTHGTRLVPMPPLRLLATGLSLEARMDVDGGVTLGIGLPTGYPATLEVFDLS